MKLFSSIKEAQASQTYDVVTFFNSSSTAKAERKQADAIAKKHGGKFSGSTSRSAHYTFKDTKSAEAFSQEILDSTEMEPSDVKETSVTASAQTKASPAFEVFASYSSSSKSKVEKAQAEAIAKKHGGKPAGHFSQAVIFSFKDEKSANAFAKDIEDNTEMSAEVHPL